MMETQPVIARVIVDVPARALSEPFDYAVPEALRAEVSIGCPVAVPLGPRRCVGYVVGLSGRSDYAGQMRDIDAVLGVPVFAEDALAIAEWIAEEYVAPLSEALRLFLPPGGAPRVARTAHGWSYEGRQMAPTAEKLVTLVEVSGFVPRANAHVQKAVLEALASGPLTTGELAADIPGAAAAVIALEKLGAVRSVERRTYRRPQGLSGPPITHQHTSEQSRAVEAIVSSVRDGGSVVLLEGVTGSGKTEVYLASIEEVLRQGRSAIVLVPEISLTPQTVGRFRSRLGDDVAVIHSRLSAGERFDQWQLALSGAVRVVVGARSALFAPLRNLGLVVIDEEHEPSYKQGQSPRYHAREVAERLCAYVGASLVLGSATPSLEALHRVQAGRYGHVRLTHRVGGGTPPQIEVVDMTGEFSAGNRSIYSTALVSALREVASRREKALLFLNRRGFASFLLCRECGFVPECDSCSVSLTYHDDTGRLECHHCGTTKPLPVMCPRCGSAYLRKFGAGTQRAETELLALVPGLHVVRMDADTTSRKGGHERALLEFESHESGVLLGTQMIAKGLDYPDVTLVGVLNADTSMHVPDFRAAERTYQLLQQVAGRAGRGIRPGRVIIQTYWPDHPAVGAVLTGNAEQLYAAERADRASLGFPPFGRIANIVTSGRSAVAVRDAAHGAADALRRAIPEDFNVVGPAPAPIARIKSNWRWHLLLKAPEGADLSGVLARLLEPVPVPEGVTRIIDVDPVGML